MIGRDIAAFLTGLIIIAVIFVLVRPGSQGPKFVTSLGQAIANMLQAASGGSASQSTGTGSGSGGGTGTQTTGATTGQGAATASTGGTA